MAFHSKACPEVSGCRGSKFEVSPDNLVDVVQKLVERAHATEKTISDLSRRFESMCDAVHGTKQEHRSLALYFKHTVDELEQVQLTLNIRIEEHLNDERLRLDDHSQRIQELEKFLSGKRAALETCQQVHRLVFPHEALMCEIDQFDEVAISRMSSSGQMSDATTVAQEGVREKAQAQKVDIKVAREALASTFLQLTEARRNAILETFNLLVTEPGGTIVVFCDDQFINSDKFHFATLDNGAFRQVFLKFGQSMKDKPNVVKELVRAFRSHSISDRWDRRLVHDLAARLHLKGAPPEMECLIDQPMDGAIMFSLNGTMVGAAERLECGISSKKLARHDGSGVGTKHQSAFAAAETIAGHQTSPAAVLVASDSGSVMLMLVDGKGSAVKVLQVLPDRNAAREGSRVSSRHSSPLRRTRSCVSS